MSDELESFTVAEMNAQFANTTPAMMAAYLAANPGVFVRAFAATPGQVAQENVDAAYQLSKLRSDHKAKQQFAEELRPRETLAPERGTLAEMLALPSEPPERVLGLIPSGASTAIIAQRKTGKTTLCLNLGHALITGEPFLGELAVRPVTGRVGFLNFEMSRPQFSRWAERRGVPEHRLYIENLRGRRNPLASKEDRAQLAARLRAQQVETLIVDPFGRAYTGVSQNDPGEVQRWLSELDMFAREEVGATDLVLAVHAGWEGGHARGASSLEDWPDSIIYLGRDKRTDARTMRAIGRDVEMDERVLMLDDDTKRQTLGDPHQADRLPNDADVDSAVAEFVGAQATPPSSGDIETALVADGIKRDAARRARVRLVRSGDLIEETRHVRGGGKQYRLEDLI